MTDDALQTFESHRSRLFGLAYRLLGSAADADDVVQDAWLRWSTADAGSVHNPAGWLTTTITRLAIDRLRSARTRREQYVGPWLPEPLLTTADDATTATDLADDLSFALLLLLERLSPTERAVFILREAFDVPFAEIATIVNTSEANCRQLLSRARRHVPDESRTRPVEPETGESVIGRFLAAIGAGDLPALAALVREDVSLHSDSGGKVTAARRVLQGATEVTNFLAGLGRIARTQQLVPDIEMVTVNQRPGLLIRLNGELDSVYAFDLDDEDRIRSIHIVRNPDKLARLRTNR